MDLVVQMQTGEDSRVNDQQIRACGACHGLSDSAGVMKQNVAGTFIFYHFMCFTPGGVVKRVRLNGHKHRLVKVVYADGRESMRVREVLDIDVWGKGQELERLYATAETYREQAI